MSDLPGAWERGGGERGATSYTHVYVEPELGYEIEVYWDHPSLSGDDRHTVVLRKRYEDENGDVETGYPERTAHAENEDAAHETAIAIMHEVIQEARSAAPQ